MSSLNRKAVLFLINLEKKYNILSGDMLDQNSLFEVQQEILQEMVEHTRSTASPVDLSKELPYLFERI